MRILELWVSVSFSDVIKHYKKLSCRREAARRSVSLKILLRQLKVTHGHLKLNRE